MQDTNASTTPIGTCVLGEPTERGISRSQPTKPRLLGRAAEAALDAMSQTPGFGNVRIHLGDEIVEVVELHLAAQMVREPDLDALAVEITVKIEEIRLKEPHATLIVKRGTTAKGDRGDVLRAPFGHESSCVYTIVGQAGVRRHCNIGRRKPQFAAPLVAEFHSPANGVWSPEQLRGSFDIALRQRGAYPRGTECLLTWLGRHESEPNDLKTKFGPHCLEQRHVAHASIPEVEVSTDYHDLRPQRVDEDIVDERLGSFLAAMHIERQHDAVIDEFRRGQKF